MSCLLMVSWVIEVEYTLTAIPQLQNREPVRRKEDHFRFQHFQAQLVSETLNTGGFQATITVGSALCWESTLQTEVNSTFHACKSFRSTQLLYRTWCPKAPFSFLKQL